MLTAPLPTSVDQVRDWTWDRFQPYIDELVARPLDADSVASWLEDWSALQALLWEWDSRLQVAVTIDTADTDAEAALERYVAEIVEPAMAADQKLKEKLLGSGLCPEGFEVPLERMASAASLYREANLPLISEGILESKEYDTICGARTAVWEGEEIPVEQLKPLLQHRDRGVRERAWRLKMDRTLADREALNTLWTTMHRRRRQMALNADLPDFRAYMWKELNRFDYTPADCESFHRAIEAVAVPATERILERRRKLLGLEGMRPWDVEVDPYGQAPLAPFETGAELIAKSQKILDRVDPELGAQFRIMADEGLLDLESRKNKAPGGYCTDFYVAQRPFIFMNATGTHDDVQTLLHEAGHAFHAFASHRLPYQGQRIFGSEIAEVASMGMELLAAPYLEGTFYGAEEAARARIKHLETQIMFWPYMAVVDAFQHWAHTHPEGGNPAACDAEWTRLWERFMKGIDYAGLEDARANGWQQKLHIFTVPFYYVEYGMAQLGAVQVWRNALADQGEALQRYRSMLALGGSSPLPQLFEAAGARFAFDAETVRSCVDLMETQIDRMLNGLA